VDVPIGRIIDNIEHYSIKHKKEVSFILARTYAMAYALNSTKTFIDAHAMELPSGEYISKSNSFSDGNKNKILIPWYDYQHKIIPFAEKMVGTKEFNQESLNYLDKAIKSYRIGLKKDPDNITGMVGLGWCLKVAKKNQEAKEIFREVISKIKKNNDLDLKIGAPITPEVAEYLISLLDAKKDAGEIREVLTLVSDIKKIPRPITPIIIPMDRHTKTYNSLIDGNNFVRFDLDGSGNKESWQWPNKRAGWLVYTKGEAIKSGLQMFGSVTFWLFWNNGYDALKSLDNNANGQLDGVELDGIAVWNDQNQNGISESEEIIAAKKFGIVAIDTSYETTKDGILASKAGIKLRSGENLPSYDFISKRVRE
jgi:tetratricopeptide (TPR) repeat protein